MEGYEPLAAAAAVRVGPSGSGAAPVDLAVAELDGATDRLWQTVARLEERLAGVLRPAAPEPEHAMTVGEVRAEPSPHVVRIETQTRSVEGSTARLENLLHRLDL